VVSGTELPFSSVESAAAAYAELWYRVLNDQPGAGCGELPADGLAGNVART
jgi:hypothetical protein